jgi:hypothetical protein
MRITIKKTSDKMMCGGKPSKMEVGGFPPKKKKSKKDVTAGAAFGKMGSMLGLRKSTGKYGAVTKQPKTVIAVTKMKPASERVKDVAPPQPKFGDTPKGKVKVKVKTPTSMKKKRMSF